jgi:hypothetical protein
MSKGGAILGTDEAEAGRSSTVSRLHACFWLEATGCL